MIRFGVLLKNSWWWLEVWLKQQDPEFKPWYCQKKKLSFRLMKKKRIFPESRMEI
jgi:hypothetical protein